MMEHLPYFNPLIYTDCKGINSAKISKEGVISTHSYTRIAR